MNNVKKYGLWAIIILSALAYLAGGVGKLMGVEMMHQSFATLGLPVAFGYFIGVCEVAGAIGLFLKRFSALAALGLGIIMVGATYYHLMFDPQGAAVSILLIVFAVVIFLAKKKDSILIGSN